MDKKGSVIHNGKKFDYIVDENRYVWFYDPLGAKTNMGQVRPLTNLDDVEDVVIQMLKGSGY